jgi:CDP-diacylglycerol--inositol 3-phosphatidyltransferase
MAGKRRDATTVLLYVPNLIGYARVVLMLASFFFAFDRPLVFLGLYWMSFLLDAADGHAARLLNQSSKVGWFSLKKEEKKEKNNNKKLMLS